MGPQCRSLKVTLRIGTFEDGPASLDHEATWLMGHTQRVDFGPPWDDGEDLFVDARLRVPCRYLQETPRGSTCGMYGYTCGTTRGGRRQPQPRRLDKDRFALIEQGRPRSRMLPPPPAPVTPARSLPVVSTPNPCATAPCCTSDHKRGAACCRDMEIEIMCDERQTRLESWIRARRSPYLCKIERAGKFSLEAELISACDYLGNDGVACTLHGRTRPDGRPAKPDLCSEWPHKGKGLHPGCVFKGSRAAGQQGSRAAGQQGSRAAGR
jgi:hypothetical protein